MDDIQVLIQGKNLLRLFEGLGLTIIISMISVVISIILGVIFGIIMTSKNPIVRFVSKVYLEFIRIMPQLVLLFLIYFGLARTVGINMPGTVAAVLAFSLWGIAEMGDLVRGAITSLPSHQMESGLALGLKKGQVFYSIIIPQVIRRLLPQAINLITRMIKTTSLVVMIGVVELVKIGQQIIESNRLDYPAAALWVYGLIFILYFITCYPISKLASKLELKWKG